jgi:hypothetical protein
MDLSRPYSSLCPTLDGDVLVVLARTRRPLTGREVARLTGRRSHVGVRNVLARLTEQGLVERMEAAPAFLYTLNRRHVAAPAVEILAGLRTDLLRRLKDAIEAWTIAPIVAAMFGSAARGDGGTQSDIDLFIVRPCAVDDDDRLWREQIEDLAVNVRAWTGNHAGIAEIAEADLPRLREEQSPIARNVRADAVVLYGRAVTEVLGTQSEVHA